MQCGCPIPEEYLEIINEREIVKWIPEPKSAVRELYVYQNIQHPNILPLASTRPVFRNNQLGLRLTRAYGDLSHFFDCPIMRKSFNIPIFEFLYQMLSVLMTLHENGIVHRDIKPANILLQLEPDPKVFLADFGSACISWGKDDCEFFTDGVCSWFYAPPEDRTGRTTPKFDVYCLGATLVHLLVASTRDESVTLPADLRPFEKHIEKLRMNRLCGRDFRILLDVVEKMVQMEPSRRPSVQDILILGLRFRWWSDLPETRTINHKVSLRAELPIGLEAAVTPCRVPPPIVRLAHRYRLRPCGFKYLQTLYSTLPEHWKKYDDYGFALLYWVLYAIQENVVTHDTLEEWHTSKVRSGKKLRDLSNKVIKCMRFVAL
jgi:serine/threonine protein kinase